MKGKINLILTQSKLPSFTFLELFLSIGKLFWPIENFMSSLLFLRVLNHRLFCFEDTTQFMWWFYLLSLSCFPIFIFLKFWFFSSFSFCFVHSHWQIILMRRIENEDSWEGLWGRCVDWGFQWIRTPFCSFLWGFCQLMRGKVRTRIYLWSAWLQWWLQWQSRGLSRTC